MPLTRRHIVLAAFEALLQGVADTEAGGRLFRNPDESFTVADDVPHLGMHDGEERFLFEESENSADRYVIEVLVSPVVKALPLEDSYNVLHGAVLDAVVKDYTLGGAASRIRYTGTDALDQPDEGTAFTWAAMAFEITFETAPNDPFTAA